MALSGSITTNSCNGRYYKLSWTATQSVSGNYSTINWTVSAHGLASGYWQTEHQLYAALGGKQVYSSTSAVNRYNGTIASSNASTAVRVHHNSDGSATFPIALSVASYTYALNLRASDNSVPLDTIPRATKISIPGSIYVGEKKTLPLNRKSAEFTHECYWKYQGSSWKKVASSATTSWGFTVSANEAGSKYPNQTSFKIDFLVRTKKGGTKIGDDQVYYGHPVYFREDTYRPSAPTLHYTKINTNGYGGDLWLEGYGYLKFWTDASGRAGSSIKSYRLRELDSGGTWRTIKTNSTGNFNVYTPYRSDAQFKIDVVDSRGFDSPWSNIVKRAYTNYKPPSVTTVNDYRDGRNITMNVGGWYQYTSDSDGTEFEIILKYGDSVLSRKTFKDVSYSNGRWNTKFNVTQETHEQKKYFLEIKNFGERTDYAYITVLADKMLMSWAKSGDGISLGRIATEDGFNVYMPTKFFKDDTTVLNTNADIGLLEETESLFKSYGWKG